MDREQSDGNLGSKELAEGGWFVAGVWLRTWTWGLGAGDGIPLVPAGGPAANVGVTFYTCLPVVFCVSFKLLFNNCLATSLSQFLAPSRCWLLRSSETCKGLPIHEPLHR